MSTQTNQPSEGVTKALSEWISSTAFSTIPPEHIVRAKHLILDGLACAIVGSHLPWSSTAARAIFAAEPSGPCTVVGWKDHSIGPLSAALLNGTFIQGFELDDYHSTAPLHSNSLLLPALFAAIQSPMSREQKLSGQDFLRAYVVGCEVGPRVGLALHGKDLLTRGWHSGAVQGPSAAAASVSNLLGLTSEQVEWALGIACTQAGGLMSAQFGSMAKRMQHGFATRNGLVGVILAREGYTGIEDVYEREYGGFLNMFSQGPVTRDRQYLPEELVKGLGENWEIEGVRVKLHAAMAGLHSTIDCVEDLQKRYPDRFNDGHLQEIEEIVTEHGDAMYHHGGWIAPENQPLSSTAAQMSIQYAAAAQLLDREVLMAQYGADKLNRPLIREVMKKVKPTHNTDFDKDPKMGFRTDLTMRFRDGTVLRSSVNAPKGIEPPVSNEDIITKWRSLVSGILSEGRRDQIEHAVLNLDTVDDVKQLLELLKGDVECPIKVSADESG